MAIELPFRLILASASRGRRYLLEKHGFSFQVIPSNVDEPMDAAYPNVRSLVEHIAWLKVAAVAARREDGIILGADSVGWLDGQVIGKPENEADARRILKMLSGKTHELWTGVCLWRRPDDLQIAYQACSRVRMLPMSEEDLDSYLTTRIWQGCSGAYAVQDDGKDPLITLESGSLSNVIGLPMEQLHARLLALHSLH